VAGWADVISAVFRTTIVQLSVPAGLLGRLSGLQIAVVTGGPSLGNLEAGAVAAALGNTVSVISGGWPASRAPSPSRACCPDSATSSSPDRKQAYRQARPRHRPRLSRPSGRRRRAPD
jgi:hypothetical protein